jgi:hypothetical protein
MALSAVGLVTVGSAATALAAGNGANGTTLSETISASPSLTKTFGWSVTKSADPATLNLFQGDNGSASYTVTATKDAGTTAASVSGQVCITNGGAVDTQGLQSTLELSMPPSGTTIQSQALDVSSEPVIPGSAAAPYQTACYPYQMTINNPVPGAYKIVADTTITNHSGHLTIPFGPQEAASFTMPSSPTLVNDSVDVQDSLAGDLGPVSDSHTFTYDLGFPSVLKEGDNPNTVQIIGDGGSVLGHADASVHVNVFPLVVTKTADTQFIRTWAWHVDKSADQTTLKLAVGETSPAVNYHLHVTSTPSDGAFAVSGAITIHNPAPMAATINGVSDVLNDGTQVTLTDAPQFPYSLAAGADLVIHYTADRSDSSAGSNTATATLQNTPAGTTDFTGSHAYSFDLSHPTVTVDGQANLTDTYAGANLPTPISASTTPQDFNYQRLIGPYSAPGTYENPNTATVAGIGDGLGNSSDWNVEANVPSNGCTLTIGYWKTHPAQLQKALGNGIQLGGILVTSTSQAITILQFSGQPSNGLYKLMGQELGAKLDIATGADGSAVASTISAADAFLVLHPASASNWSGLSKTQQAQVNTWATALDTYNNGLTGPGHCSQ